MKKHLLLVVVIVLVGAGCTNTTNINKKTEEKTNKTTTELEDLKNKEEEFNNSGRAKAIINETNLWKFYEDKNAYFSIKYPHNINFGENKENGPYTLSIESKKISELEGTMGFNKETAQENFELLKTGEYGKDVDWPIKESKKVVRVKNINSQDFMVLSRFEICDVTFQRKLYFFNNDHQIVITFSGEKDLFVNIAPEYFIINEKNCGNDKIWNLDKQGQFYNDLENNKGAEVIQEWFNLFGEIIETIEFSNKQSLNLDLLQGKWESTDDYNSVILFKGDKKIDYHANVKLTEENFEIEDNYLIVGKDKDILKYKILALSEDTLLVSFLPRGNTLKYQKKEK